MDVFVTAGSSAPFDSLTIRADELKRDGTIGGKLIMQIGNGTYIPKHCDEWFRFTPDLIPYLSKADLVITHSGDATLGEIMRLGKKAISVPNYNIDDTFELAMKLARAGHILFCPHLIRLHLFIKYSEDWTPTPYTNPNFNPSKLVKAFGEQ